MTNLLRFTVNARKSHHQPQCNLKLLREDGVFFVWVDLHVSLCGQQHPKCHREIRLMRPNFFCNLRSTSNPSYKNLKFIFGIKLYMFRTFLWYFVDRASQYIYLNINQLDELNVIMSLFHASTRFEHHVFIVRRSELYYTTSGIITPLGCRPVHGTATYRCDDTRGCIIQFYPPDDKHMCSKHAEAWNKLIIKFSASSWLILR